MSKWRLSNREWPDPARDLETFSDEDLNYLCGEINRIQCERANSVLLNPAYDTAKDGNNAAG
jgi:hypothetical protein